MSITISRNRVKEKCSISVTTYDTTIDNLIAEMGPVITYALRPEFANGELDSGLQATLDLGSTEIVCGEIMAQIFREPGAIEGGVFGSLQVYSLKQDPNLMIAAGWARLRPFLRLDSAIPVPSQVWYGSDKDTGTDE